MKNKTISPKITALVFGTLVICFAIAFYVVAWQEPTQAPPGGNVPTPLNVGPTGQSKAGGLILNTGGAATGLIIDKGQICIGTDCRSKWPETGVIITYQMSASSYQVGNNYYSKTVSYDCPVGSDAVLTYCKEIMVSVGRTVQPPLEQKNACECSVSGNHASLKAYVLQAIEYEHGTNYALVDSCYPHATMTLWYTCYTKGPCQMEFQCGIKQTVGQ